ncbi:hypothetical protein HOL34_02800 [bacterium]|jgi:hypothetical protein|nr:hypothetical protein [bacterium]MBT3903988.1 hypothetical protein [bacterium]MBT5346013.1 hypothetical protein [bacterium]MBT6131250.1 hypothetical protein [bacterium]MBT6529006.1 hypothetical protein [bacterium]
MDVRVDWRSFLGGYIDWVDEVVGLRRIALIIGVIVLSGGSWYGYRLYRNGVETSAQRTMSSLFDLWQQAVMNRKGEQSLWKQLSDDSQHAMKQHASSNLRPFFSILYAQGLMRAQPSAQQAKEAVALLQDGIKRMATSHPYYPAMQLESAKIMLDASQRFGVASHDQAITILNAISTDKNNAFSTMAQAQIAYDKAYQSNAKH